MHSTQSMKEPQVPAGYRNRTQRATNRSEECHKNVVEVFARHAARETVERSLGAAVHKRHDGRPSDARECAADADAADAEILEFLRAKARPHHHDVHRLRSDRPHDGCYLALFPHAWSRTGSPRPH